VQNGESINEIKHSLEQDKLEDAMFHQQSKPAPNFMQVFPCFLLFAGLMLPCCCYLYPLELVLCVKIALHSFLTVVFLNQVGAFTITNLLHESS